MARNPYSYDNMVINDDSDIEKLKNFFNLFNEKNKFTDSKFKVTTNLPNDVDQGRISDTYGMSEGLIVPTGLGSAGSVPFELELYNDEDKGYTTYYIDPTGKARFFYEIKPGGTFKVSTHIGHIWYLKSMVNEDDVYVVKVGDSPVEVSSQVIEFSAITTTVQDFLIEPVIFDREYDEAYNSKQGGIGDCYLLGCLISIYSYDPEIIYSKFLFPELMNQTGAVVIKLWDNNESCWKTTIMDDYLPKRGNNWFGSGPTADRTEYWVPLLEKVFAKKKAGNYSDLAGHCGKVSSKDIYEMICGPVRNTYMEFKISDKNFETFNKFFEYYQNGAIMSLCSRTSDTFIDKKTNLVGLHAYGLVDVQVDVTKQKLTLIKCHNPWSQGGEWSGDWSDSSPLWDKYPDVKEELGFEKKDDGTFWIEKKDIGKAFCGAFVAEFVAEEGTANNEEDVAEVPETVPNQSQMKPKSKSCSIL